MRFASAARSYSKPRAISTDMITSEMIFTLRSATGAGNLACLHALSLTRGDLEAAADYLRLQGFVINEPDREALTPALERMDPRESALLDEALRKANARLAAIHDTERREAELREATLPEGEARETILRETERREAAARAVELREGMNRVRELIIEYILQHQTVLLAKYQTTRFKDAYGQWVEKGWDREVEYFYEHVVQGRVDEILGPVGGAQLIVRFNQLAAKVYIPCDEDAFGTDLGSPFAWMSCTLIKSHIATLAEQLPRELSADPNVADISPAEYERYCAGLLEEAGWNPIVLASSGDQGVDILAERNGKKLVVQCKYYSQPVGNGAVQEVHAGKAVHGADLACVVSNCDFTPGARIAATRTGVLLLHHNQLRDVARALDEK